MGIKIERTNKITKMEWLIDMTNLKMIRVQSKLGELFANKIDLADAKNDEERQNKYYTRAIAA